MQSAYARKPPGPMEFAERDALAWASQRFIGVKKYADRSHDSGIRAYEIGKDSITIQFINGGTYLYNYASAGKRHIERMKTLAESGDGLNTYLNQHASEAYAAKLS